MTQPSAVTLTKPEMSRSCSTVPATDRVWSPDSGVRLVPAGTPVFVASGQVRVDNRSRLTVNRAGNPGGAPRNGPAAPSTGSGGTWVGSSDDSRTVAGLPRTYTTSSTEK